MKFDIAQAVADYATYHRALLAGADEACIRIEERYGLFGYPPEIVSVGLKAAAEGVDVDDAVADHLGQP
jgi:hypothetical protein